MKPAPIADDVSEFLAATTFVWKTQDKQDKFNSLTNFSFVQHVWNKDKHFH